MDNNQLSLPYLEIKKVASRDYLRENFTRSSREVYKIPFESLLIREGFNKRIVYDDIESLADSIAAKGLETPLDVDVLPTGEVYIEKGHKRYKAIKFNRDRGIIMDTVDCYPNPKEKTELQRMTDIYSSNMHSSKLNSVEQANVIFALKNNFGEISNEEIGKRLGISRQQVDNLLILASADDATKQEILNGNLGITEAVKYIRSLKKAQKDADQSELNANKNPSAAAQEPKDALANDLKELAALEEETPEERDQRLLRENTKREQELEQLMEISDEIKVKPETLPEHLGRKLSAPVLHGWVEDFVDEGTGEVVTIERYLAVVGKDEIITDEVMATILKTDGVDTILVYKKGMEPVAKSVVTVLPGEKEKEKYDSNRLEIQQIQNCIGLADKLEAIVNKLDVPDGVKKDVTSIVGWMQKDLAECREYIHKNKKENKAR